MPPHDTAPGDDPQLGGFQRAGDEAQRQWDIATGKRGAVWKGGRFRGGGGGGGCLISGLAVVLGIAVVGALAARD